MRKTEFIFNRQVYYAAFRMTLCYNQNRQLKETAHFLWHQGSIKSLALSWQTKTLKNWPILQNIPLAKEVYLRREINITPRKYFNQRLLNKDGRLASDVDYLLAAPYAVEARQVSDDIKIFLRQMRGQTFQNKTINIGLMKVSDNVQAMLRTDTVFKFMKNLRSSPAYWNTVLFDLLAMVRQLGIPAWFSTLSAADMQWPEVIKSIAHQ